MVRLAGPDVNPLFGVGPTFFYDDLKGIQAVPGVVSDGLASGTCGLCGLSVCRMPELQSLIETSGEVDKMLSGKPRSRLRRVQRDTHRLALQLRFLCGPFGPKKSPLFVHRFCALWHPDMETVEELDGTFSLLASRVVSVVKDCQRKICKECKRPGASVWCGAEGCDQTVHYPCACNHPGWMLKINPEDEWVCRCPLHAQEFAMLLLETATAPPPSCYESLSPTVVSSEDSDSSEDLSTAGPVAVLMEDSVSVPMSPKPTPTFAVPGTPPRHSHVERPSDRRRSAFRRLSFHSIRSSRCKAPPTSSRPTPPSLEPVANPGNATKIANICQWRQCIDPALSPLRDPEGFHMEHFARTPLRNALCKHGAVRPAPGMLPPSPGSFSGLLSPSPASSFSLDKENPTRARTPQTPRHSPSPLPSKGSGCPPPPARTPLSARRTNEPRGMTIDVLNAAWKVPSKGKEQCQEEPFPVTTKSANDSHCFACTEDTAQSSLLTRCTRCLQPAHWQCTKEMTPPLVCSSCFPGSSSCLR
eukprot:NODE_580_length_1952_cov_27.133999_g466_i0.p1 GENE.NODE_580_length_1952_cov_27.133999_g466_i0~~NODE_580_length_1952_cov_27.133999_g466_i0.p1  ORF type:complete len:614 (+),score=88.65 NODE_580_length_1952_cov_27.133999_g466_i0:256-1842(+)